MQEDDADARRYHDRAERSGNEAKKIIFGLSSGGIGVLFVALTGKVDPPLQLVEKVVVSLGSISFGVSVLIGIVVWKLDAQSFYWRARAIQTKDSKRKPVLFNKSIRLHAQKRILTKLQAPAFGAGIVSLGIYTIYRAVFQA